MESPSSSLLVCYARAASLSTCKQTSFLSERVHLSSGVCCSFYPPSGSAGSLPQQKQVCLLASPTFVQILKRQLHTCHRVLTTLSRYIGNHFSNDVALYYIKCDGTVISPFGNELLAAQGQIQTGISTLAQIDQDPDAPNTVGLLSILGT